MYKVGNLVFDCDINEIMTLTKSKTMSWEVEPDKRSRTEKKNSEGGMKDCGVLRGASRKKEGDMITTLVSAGVPRNQGK